MCVHVYVCMGVCIHVCVGVIGGGECEIVANGPQISVAKLHVQV